MSANTSQDFESYVPVYDAIPEKWEDSRPFIVEMLRKLSNAVNVRSIGYYLDEEVLTGSQFIPNENTPQQFRNIFRKVIDSGPLVMGVTKLIDHGIIFDDNFTQIICYTTGTDRINHISSSFMEPYVEMLETQVSITSPANYDISYTIIDYLLEA